MGYYLSDIRLSRLKYPTIPCVFRIERDGNYHVAGEGNLLQSFSMPLGRVYLPVQVKNLKQSKSLSVGEWVKKWIWSCDGNYTAVKSDVLNLCKLQSQKHNEEWRKLWKRYIITIFVAIKPYISRLYFFLDMHAFKYI